MKLKLTIILFLFSILSIAQQNTLSENAEISILTIGPGANLNDYFGHSALRVKTESLDYVFNYGVFDFDAPNFYLNFAKGKLNFKLALQPFSQFSNGYKRQNRWIKEQVLNLSQDEKQNVFNFLIENIKPENQYYLYEFFFDNCATKPRDVINNALNNSLDFNTPDSFKPKSFRRLIHSHINQNSWGSFGIDLALGSKIDKIATPEEHMFLPNYLHQFFEKATKKDGTSIIKSSKLIVQNKAIAKKNNLWFSPLMVFGLLGVIIMFITFKDYKQHKRTKWLDISIFLITGLIGVILLLLWFATDHSGTAHNYNLLWAFALNMFIIAQLYKTKPKAWFTKYLKFLVIMLCLLALHWSIGVQVFSITLIPLLLALTLRYVYLIYYYQNTKQL